MARLLHFYHELEEWQQDNHYIRSGYVRGTNSYSKSLQSLFYLHNETVNIYSHLIPSVLVLVCVNLWMKFVDHFDFLVWEWLNFNLFAVSLTFCLFMSSTFHTMKSHSHKVSRFGNRLDYFGIIILITCSLMSIINFAYYDQKATKYTFNVLFMVLGGVCTFFTLDPKFASNYYRPIRSTMFILFGLSGVLPVATAVYQFGFAVASERSGFKYLVGEGLFYISGAVLYAARVPERFTHVEQEEERPLNNPIAGRFDIFGHSHQIFHVFVVVAAFCHWKALVQCFLYYRKYLT